MLQNPDVRWRQRFQSFRKALTQLMAAADLAKQRKLSDLEQQGLIQAFEFTHELAWNILKDFLESRGVANLYGSKDATREGFARGLIVNGDEWMAMIQSPTAARTPTTKRPLKKSAMRSCPALWENSRRFAPNSPTWRHRTHEPASRP